MVGSELLQQPRSIEGVPSAVVPTTITYAVRVVPSGRSFRGAPAGERKDRSGCSTRSSIRSSRAPNLASRKLARGNQRGAGRGCRQSRLHRGRGRSTGPTRGEKVILVRRETSPEDVGGMYVAQGILTATGGKTSHAAVVARGWGKCCIVGAEKIDIDADAKKMSSNGHVVREGDWITLDGGDGSVYSGEIELARPEPPKAYETLMKWADEVRRLRRAHQRGHAARRSRSARDGRRRASASAAPSTCSSRISSIRKKAPSGSKPFRK